MKAIPIILLTRNEPEHLSRTIDSIEKTTKYPYELFVIDNCSDDEEQLNVLSAISNKHNVYYAKRNLWILSLNPILRKIVNDTKYDNDYLVISDSDIEIINYSGDKCWLYKLRSKMELNPFIGKLGASLSLSNLKERKDLEKTYLREKSFYKKKLCNGIYLAPVDTTLAIYKKDLFVSSSFRLYPGHMSYIKPFYYVGRSEEVHVKHLGWDNYGLVNNALESKIKCFALCGAYIDSYNLEQVSGRIRLFYKVIHPLSKAFWGARLVYSWCKIFWIT